MGKLNKSNFIVLSLYELLEVVGEDGFYDIVSNFSCPKDQDIEFFIKNKAIPFSRAEFYSSRTYLVGFEGESGKFRLCGYFTLMNKPFELSGDLSKGKRKVICEGQTRVSGLSGILIGQLGKNYTDGLNMTISGNDLLACALDYVHQVYMSVGVQLVFVECKDVEKLRIFYEDNGFDLYMDKNGEPILHNGLLCYIAKYKNLIVNKISE